VGASCHGADQASLSRSLVKGTHVRSVTPGGIIDGRQRIGGGLQGDGIGFAVRIGLIDGVDQASHITGPTRKVCSLAGMPEPEETDKQRHDQPSAPHAYNPAAVAPPDRTSQRTRVRHIHGLSGSTTAITEGASRL
jgi:hypothetical protein